MELWECHCKWRFVISIYHMKVYGPIIKMGIGDYPDSLMNIQRLMDIEEWRNEYADCAALYDK